MPRRRKSTKKEHLVMQPTKGKEPLPVEYHAEGSPELIERRIKEGEMAAKLVGTDLRVIRTSGKTSVSFSGVSQKAWEKIFGKRKGKGKKGK